MVDDVLSTINTVTTDNHGHRLETYHLRELIIATTFMQKLKMTGIYHMFWNYV